MEIKDLINLLAILLSPIIAVLVTIWMQDRREKRGRMHWVLATVVANRHQKVAVEVVQALNSIDIVFTNNVEVRRLWKEYMDITEQNFEQPNIYKKLDDEYVELIDAMAKALGYGGKVSQIEIGKAYSPTGLGDQALQTQELLRHALRVFKGEQALMVAAHQSEQPPVEGTPIDPGSKPPASN